MLTPPRRGFIFTVEISLSICCFGHSATSGVARRDAWLYQRDGSRRAHWRARAYGPGDASRAEPPTYRKALFMAPRCLRFSPCQKWSRG